ncbi:Histone chaperone asf1 [Nowakowskiella sp. JEL0078]|nr:Histone chaperone asf1 [Nowakowskiella sp. JEL0078]
MSLVNLTNINILNNPSSFLSPFTFEITFEVLENLQEGYLFLHVKFNSEEFTLFALDLEFKVIYVGSAEKSDFDQELESVLVGPVPLGDNQFILTTEPPNPENIPKEDILGVTVVFLSCLYKSKEFVRVGYYSNTEYEDPALNENPPSKIDYSILKRLILADKPRLTRFSIPWDEAEKPFEISETNDEMDEDQEDLVEEEEDLDEETGDEEEIELVESDEEEEEEEFEENGDQGTSSMKLDDDDGSDDVTMVVEA